MNVCLEVKNLTAGYGSTTIVRDVSFSVDKGSALCLLGLNGAGKTTLLKALCGLLPYTGSVVLNGKEISHLTGAKINHAGLAYSPQENGVFAGLTVDEHLRLARRFDANNLQRQEELLELFPALGERLSQHAQTLSGGQRKMLNFVMALSSGPSIVLMDEPTEGVAPVVREQLVEALKVISKMVSIVIVEQNLDTALALSTQGHVMERGRIVASGDVNQMHSSGLLEKLLAV